MNHNEYESMKNRKSRATLMVAGVVGVLMLLGQGCPVSNEAKVRVGVDAGKREAKMEEGIKVMMEEGKMMTEKNGDKEPMKKDMMAADGSKVTLDGTVMMKDGASVTLKEGEAVMAKDGTIKVDAEAAASGEVMIKKEAVGGEAMVKTETKVEVMTKEDSPAVKKEPESSVAPGSYEAYDSAKLSLANNGKVVLYFSAAWCPICRVADSNFRSAAIPAGLYVLKIDYDTATELRQKYGVTYQHTFVQVDSGGNQIKKWSGSRTIEEILERAS